MSWGISASLSDLLHSVWQSLCPSIFCSIFLLLSVSVLFPTSPLQRKSQALSNRNLWASCITIPALLLPLWTYLCLSLLPQCLLSAFGLDRVCLCCRASLCGALLQWLHDSFSHPQESSSITGHRFPHILSPYFKPCCLHPPPMALCLLPLLHLHPEHFFPWGHCLSLYLRWWRAAGGRELCCVLLHPRTRRGFSIQ